jgi:hypothetical protein
MLKLSNIDTWKNDENPLSGGELITSAPYQNFSIIQKILEKKSFSVTFEREFFMKFFSIFFHREL